MKANNLIKNKGIQYAIEIVENAPEGVLAWNEGYEFTCGQSVNISDEDREKYFVDMAELKHLVESHELIKRDFETVEMAEYEYMVSASYDDPYWIRVKQAISDVKSCGGERG